MCQATTGWEHGALSRFAMEHIIGMSHSSTNFKVINVLGHLAVNSKQNRRRPSAGEHWCQLAVVQDQTVAARIRALSGATQWPQPWQQ